MKSKMTGFGWKEEMVMTQGKNSMVSYKKGERTAMANINTDQKNTQITLTAAEPKSSKK
jgi:ribosomal protein S1